MNGLPLGWGAAAALLAVVALAFWLGRATARGERGDLSGPPAGMPPRAMAGTAVDAAGLPPEQLGAIRDAIARGNKIAAIKLMREATGLGLAEAKQAVEALGG
jgi:hypothetical protein